MKTIKILIFLLAVNAQAVEEDQEPVEIREWPSEDETLEAFNKWNEHVIRLLKTGRVYTKKHAWLECERWLREKVLGPANTPKEGDAK